MTHWKSKPKTLKHLGGDGGQNEATLNLCKIIQCVFPSLMSEKLLSIGMTKLQISQKC